MLATYKRSLFYNLSVDYRQFVGHFLKENGSPQIIGTKEVYVKYGLKE